MLDNQFALFHSFNSSGKYFNSTPHAQAAPQRGAMFVLAPMELSISARSTPLGCAMHLTLFYKHSTPPELHKKNMKSAGPFL